MINILPSFLVIEDLNKRYGNKQALKNVSLTIGKNQIVALVGENGAGKSTLLSAIVGLVQADSGSINFLDQRITGSGSPEICFAGQDLPLPSALTVKQLIRITELMNSNFDSKYALTRLNKLGIPLNGKYGRLSGGTKAEVALTLALSRYSSLVILDEPLANLDPVAKIQATRDILMRKLETNASFIISTHSINELQAICDSIVLLSNGEISLLGSVDDLLESHVVYLCDPRELEGLPQESIVLRSLESGFSSNLARKIPGVPPLKIESRQASLDEIIISYLQRNLEIGRLSRIGTSEGKFAHDKI